MNTQEIFTLIIKLVVTLVIGLCSVYVIPWLKNKYSKEKRENILSNIDVLVQAAEQIADVWDHDGSWKKQHVIDVLASLGITITEEIDDYIEAAVYKLKSEFVANEKE